MAKTINRAASVAGLVLMCVSVAVAQTGRREVLVTEYGDLAKVRLSFDSSRIARPLLNDLLRISPYDPGTLVPPSLELCITADPEYRACGARRIDSENFFYNADVNLKRGQKMLDFIDQLKVPAVLKPVAAFHHRATSFWLCLERAQLAYYRGNDRALLAMCDTVDAFNACPAAVQQAPLAQSQAAREELTRTWHKCMNAAFHRRLGQYPQKQWRTFLKAYGIRETVVQIRD